MSTGVLAGGMLSADEQRLLTTQWRSLRRLATGVAVLSSPAVFVYLHKQQGWAIGWSLAATPLSIAASRALPALNFPRFPRWPSLFGIDPAELREEDVVARRRATTSSSRSSAVSIPKRLGQRGNRGKFRAGRAREAAIESGVAASDQPIAQPCCLWR